MGAPTPQATTDALQEGHALGNATKAPLKANAKGKSKSRKKKIDALVEDDKENEEGAIVATDPSQGLLMQKN